MARAKRNSPPTPVITQPLEGTTWVIDGNFADVADVKAKLTDLGAKIAATVTRNTTHILSTQDTVNAGSAKLTAAAAKNLPIVSEALLTSSAVTSANSVDDIDFSKFALTPAPVVVPATAAVSKTDDDDDTAAAAKPAKRARGARSAVASPVASPVAVAPVAAPAPAPTDFSNAVVCLIGAAFTPSKAAFQAAIETAGAQIAATPAGKKVTHVILGSDVDPASPPTAVATAAKRGVSVVAATTIVLAAAPAPVVAAPAPAPAAAAASATVTAVFANTIWIPASAAVAGKDQVTAAGGKFGARVTNSVNFVLADAATASAKAVKDALAKNIPVVNAAFVTAAIAVGDWKALDVTKFAVAAATAATVAAPAPPPAYMDGAVVVLSESHDTSARSVLEAKIKQAGGSIATKLTKKVTHLLCHASDFLHNSKLATAAANGDTPMIQVSFLDAAAAAGSWEKVQGDKHLLVPSKAAAPAAAGAAGGAAAGAPAPPVLTKVIKKGRVPLDAELPADIKAGYHVYEDSMGAWHATLNQSNVKENNNKFYIIQLLASDAGGKFCTWNRWGRVGVAGQNSLRSFSSVDSAKADFASKYRDKTLNVWGASNFVTHPNKYTLVVTSYDDDDDKPAAAKPAAAAASDTKVPDSKLDKPLQDLVRLICNVEEMTKAMVEIGFDAQRCPLGKLSRDTLLQGYAVLKKLEAVIVQGQPGSVQDLSSQFYSLIPHNFGFKHMSQFVIRDAQTLKAKLDMLEQLADVALATQLLQSSSAVAAAASMNPVDSAYERLKCGLTTMDKSSTRFKLLNQYLQNTHASTHSQYSLEIEQAFEVDRHNEAAVFCGDSIDNHTLLWHGSRLTNFVGILSQGLRIAPPEAPVTGYMFGKGVYFADMSSKSANYCFTSPSSNTGILLLCEVALGTPRPLLGADYNANRLPAGTHSTWGQGKTEPDTKEDEYIDLDGTRVRVPAGHGVPMPRAGSLLYNEFIVYNTNQVRIRYLLRTKFHYKGAAARGW